jgi:hypothetical protein
MVPSPNATSSTDLSSPKSVVPGDAPHELVEPLQLDPTTENISKQAGWVCPASAKSGRTINPIRAIVDPIAKQIKSGTERGDGKDPISLAVSSFCLQSMLWYTITFFSFFVSDFLAWGSNCWWKSTALSNCSGQCRKSGIG